MQLWLIVLQDKDLAGEPDTGMVFIEGNELAAQRAVADIERAARDAGSCRCVGRYREVERGKQYRATALVKTNRPSFDK